MKHFVLIFKEKHGDQYYHIREESLKEDQSKAFQNLFEERDAEEGWYFPEDMTVKERRLYRLAQDGDRKAIVDFMDSRNNCEYESFELEELTEVDE